MSAGELTPEDYAIWQATIGSSGQDTRVGYGLAHLKDWAVFACPVPAGENRMLVMATIGMPMDQVAEVMRG